MANPELTGEESRFDRKARKLVRATAITSPQRRSSSRKIARGLGWFSLGLGLIELLAAPRLARAIGMRGSENVLQAYGVREIVTGLGLLMSDEPAPTAMWVWGRVAGDAMDLSTLAAAAVNPRPADAHPVAAMAAVAGVAALDLTCARALQWEARVAQQTTDYGDRSGLPGSPQEARGAALPTFTQPPDMRISPPLNGGTLH